MREKILIVEDEKDISRMLEYNLKKEGFVVRSVHDGEHAVDAVRKERFDLMILDIMLPGMDGLEVCRILKGQRESASLPIIMLTAKVQETDKVVGLELGADDYVGKPFSVRELIARVKAVLRRMSDKNASPEVFSAGSLTVDFAKIRVCLKGKAVDLTAKEFELLKALIKAKGRVLSRDYLLDNLWGFERSLEIQTRTVDVHINTLRKKIGHEAVRIVTVKSYGYRFKNDD